MAATIELDEGMRHDTVIRILKYASEEAFLSGDAPEDEFVHRGNLITQAGAGAVWGLTIVDGTTTAFNNANAHVGVGDSATAATTGQTDLQASTNKLRKAVAAGSPGRSTNQVTWMSIFGSAEANFAWNEMAVFNAAVSGVMLNRSVISGGTKGAGTTWVAICTITLT